MPTPQPTNGDDMNPAPLVHPDFAAMLQARFDSLVAETRRQAAAAFALMTDHIRRHYRALAPLIAVIQRAERRQRRHARRHAPLAPRVPRSRRAAELSALRTEMGRRRKSKHR